MFEGKDDTRPETAAIMRKLMRAATPARKLEMAGQMYETVKILSIAGLKSRFPNDTPQMTRRRLADILLGKDLAVKVYGPPVE